MKPLRCAVYTRKSTEDGLEQEFNSLDAQREACEAYILSQRHEGWTLVPNRYDDGGFSGGSMHRPGLKALLADIEAGLVDVIVVYKVDRLTRSLADFAKIVEQLDAKQASFVSVTQAFNTTTSMGRLTLNVLLSFAQFEREVTGERIRDKIAASKKKGMWMGGPVPLGYEVVDRKLVPVPEEAERVRKIMRRYLDIRSVPALIEVLRREGIVTKVQNRTSGPHKGGIPFRRGSLFHLLKNPIYRGKIVHKGQVYEGEHEPIVDEDLWDAVQAQLNEKAPSRKRPTNDPQQAHAARPADRSTRSTDGPDLCHQAQPPLRILRDPQGSWLGPPIRQLPGSRRVNSSDILSCSSPSCWRMSMHCADCRGSKKRVNCGPCSRLVGCLPVGLRSKVRAKQSCKI